MHLGHDLRHSFRLLTRNPGFTAAAVLILALAIGVNSAVFTLVNAMLLRPITGVDGSRLVGVYSRDKATPDRYRSFSYEEYREIAAAGQPFDVVAARNFAMVGLGTGETTRRVFAEIVSSSYFDMLGVPVARGRSFSPDEEAPAALQRVAVLSHGLWKRLGAGDALLGSSLRVNGQEFTVIGVAPEGFSGTMAIASPEMWLPLGVYDSVLNDFQQEGEHRTLADPLHRNLIVNARLAPGLTVADATGRLGALLQRLVTLRADNAGQELVIAVLPRLGVSSEPMSSTEPAIASALLMAMASLVLVVACLNLANMLLARGESRRKEIAVRLALGAGRGRIVRQLLTEGLVLSVLGGAVGLLLAWMASRLVVASLAPLAPIAIVLRTDPDVRVLAATLGFCVLSAVVFGLGPALRLSRTDVYAQLKDHVADLRIGGRRFAARNLLLVGQIALSLALLATGGLFVRGARSAADADPGFSLERGVVVEVDPSLASEDEAAGRATYRAVLDRLRAVPGVESASLASTVPFGSFSESERVLRGGEPATDSHRGEPAQHVIIGTGYFETLGLRLLRGRDFTPAEEVGGTERVAIVNEPLARKLWPGEDPVGRQISFAPGSGDPATPPLLVVGVAPGMRHDVSDAEPIPHVFVPFGSNYRSGMNLHVRAAGGGPETTVALLATVREEIRAAAPHMPIVSASTLVTHRDDSISLWMVRTGARLFTLFGAVALALAVVGIYGVKAWLVSRRTREIGIRMALGATTRDVVRLVLGEGAVVTASGLALGLVLAVLSGQVVSSVLYRVSPWDPVVLATSTLALGGAALVAAWIPARRAARVLPSQALRTE
jgi:predicted permease